MSNSLLYFFARESHQSCLIPWPTGSKWHCFISFKPGSLTNHVSSHDQQQVSGTALFLCQEVSSIMSHPMTHSLWVTLLYFFAQQSYQSCLIPWPTGSKWDCFISLSGSLINHVSSHDPQDVSDTTLFLCQGVSSIMSHPMTNSEWVALLYFFVPGSLFNHVSSPIEQVVSLMNFTTTSFIASHPMNNFSLWETSHFCMISLHMTNR